VSTNNDQQQQQQQQTILFSNRVWDKPFWKWNIEEHKVADIITKGNCCFNQVKQTHGFRKFAITMMDKAGVKDTHRRYLTGHAQAAQDGS
jgi:hypothetical protein